MKKLFLISLVIVLVSGIIISGCTKTTPTPTSTTPIPTATTPPSEPITLLFGYYDVEFGAQANILKEWAKELEQKSNGQVKIEFSWASALGSMMEYYNLVSQGVCDIAATMPIMRTGAVAFEEIASLPWTAPYAAQLAKAQYVLYEKGFLQKDFADTKLCFVSVGSGATTLFSNKPIRSLADMKGKIFSTGSQLLISEIEAMGGKIAWVPPQENYTALQKGTTDATTGTWAILEPMKLIEVLDYAIPGFGSLSFDVTMNIDSWNKLPEDVQKIILDLSSVYGVKLGEAVDRDDETGKKAFLAQGKEINNWSEQDLAKIEELLKPIWAKYIADWQAKGVNVQEAIDVFWYALKDQGIENPAMGYSPAK